jgi:ABC-type multidrug transport system permease subunit
MTFLPMVERELRVAARRRGTYWLRSGTGLAAALTFLWIWIGEIFQRIPGSGVRLFLLLTVGAFVFCLAAGAIFTADAVSEEKREGTLGLLFLTPLRGYDVILGKLVGRALNAIYGLLSMLPVLAVPLILGGVTHGQVLRTSLALASTLFLSVSVGLLVSTLGRRERVTIGATLGVMVAVTFGLLPFHPMGAGGGWQSVPGWSWLSPAICVLAAQEPAAGGNLQAFWNAWLIQIGLALLVLTLACLLVWRVLEERAAPIWRHGCADREGPWGRGAAQPALDPAQPYRWLADRGRLNSGIIWAGLGILAAAGLLGRLALQGSPLGLAVGLATIAFLQGAVKLWMISDSVHRLAEDRQLGTLELLLISRVSPSEVRLSIQASLRERAALPAIFVVLAGFLMMGADTAVGGGQLGLWLVASAFVLTIDLAAIRTLGPWAGLSAGKTSRAVLATAWQLLVVPWLVFAALLLLFGLKWHQGLSLGHAWLVICAVNNLVWYSWAWPGLKHRYEVFATARFGHLPPPATPDSDSQEQNRGVAGLFQTEPIV